MRKATLSIWFIFLSAAVACAQEQGSNLTDLSLEKLMEIEVGNVYSASKFEQKVTEAPSSVTIVTADEIRKYGYRTLADILRSLRGFFTSYDRNYSHIGVRGFGPPGDYNSRILFLIDGHRVNDNIFDGALVETGFILDVDLIDRIEVVRGPSSSLYGTNAFFGVVNIVTRGWKEIKLAEASGEVGTSDTYKGRVTLGHQFKNGLGALVSGSYYRSAGQDRLYFKEFGRSAYDVDDDTSYSFFSKLSFGDFTFEGVHVSREKVVPTASYGTVFNSPKNRTVDESTFFDLKYQRRFENTLDLMARVFYDRYEYRGDYLFDKGGFGNPSDFVLNKDVSLGDWWGAEAQVSRKFLDKFQCILGAEYRDNIRQDQDNYDERPFLQYLHDRRNSKVWALYAQTEFPILRNLRLNAGIRYDHYETFGSTTNPRLAVIYQPFEKSFVKFLYGQAFRAPNFFELYYNDGGTSSKPSPGLEPEEIKTYEMVWEQYFGRHVRSVVTGYYYRIKNLISQEVDPLDGLLVFRNMDEIEAKGIELEVEGKWPNGLTGRISYAFQETRNKKSHDLLLNSPRHLAKANLTVPLIRDKLFLGIEEQYTSKRKTLAGNEAGSFFLTNLTLFNQNVLKGLEVSASVYNLFDREYSDPGSSEHVQDLLKQDGRSFRFKLTYRF